MAYAAHLQSSYSFPILLLDHRLWIRPNSFVHKLPSVNSHGFGSLPAPGAGAPCNKLIYIFRNILNRGCRYVDNRSEPAWLREMWKGITCSQLLDGLRLILRLFTPHLWGYLSTFRSFFGGFTTFPQPFNRLSTVHKQSYTHIFFLMISILFFNSSLEESSSSIFFIP